jgi:putative endonuclease
MLAKDILGRDGEQLAAAHLLSKGMEILDRNWRCRQGELDIVAADECCLVFCEVKTRRSNAFGSPLEAVDSRKAARIRRLAMTWLSENPGVHADQRWTELRFDVVGVICRPGEPAEIVHVEAAF